MKDHKIDFAIGGQALIEGILMRSPHFNSIAVRDTKGKIITKVTPYNSWLRRYKLGKIPIVRGVVNLVEMMGVGIGALNYSAEIFADEGDEKPTEKSKSSIGMVLSMIVSIFFSLGLALVFFKVLPLWLTEQLSLYFPVLKNQYVLFNIVDGLIRITLFIGYIGVLSLFKSFRRIFAYHGAEHMAVHTYEKGLSLTPEHVKQFSPRHPRCGTSFLMAVFIVSIIIFSIIPKNPVFWLNLLQRIAVIPLIAGIGYEVLKWSSKHVEHPLMKIVVAPGLLTQLITTKQPEHDQVEVAIAALNGALEAETRHSTP